MADGRPVYTPFCTATLIAPRVVLTAKHCTLSKARYGFATGLHAATVLTIAEGPARVVPVERAEEESTIRGAAASGMGSDVSVVYLKEPIVDVTPLPLGDLRDADVGKTFTAIGYGDRGKNNPGVRTSGKVVLEARRGKALASVLPFEEYDRLLGGDSNENRSFYDGLELLDGYEVMTSRAKGAGGVQPCDGDSGGPLLGLRGGKPQVFGVASLVLSTQADLCAIGTVYATLGPAARALIARAIATSQ